MAGRIETPLALAALLAVVFGAAACTRTLPEPTGASGTKVTSTAAATSPGATIPPQPRFEVFTAEDRPMLRDTGRVAWTPFTVGNRIAFGHGAAWVLGRDMLYRIDPASHRITASLAVLGASGFVATGAGGVWVTGRRQLIKVDPTSGRKLGSARFPKYVGSVVVAGGAVWVAHTAGQYSGGLWKIDPRTLTIERDLPVGDLVQMLVARGSIWIHGPNLGWLERLDPETGRIWKTQTFVDRGSVLARAGYIWITDQGSGSVRKIAISTGRAVHTWDLRHAESPASGPAFWCIPARDTVSCLSDGLGRTFAWSIDATKNVIRPVQPPRYLPSAFGFGRFWSLLDRAVVMTRPGRT
jgi:hypothetical protein